MTAIHVALALLVAVVWGLAFVATRVALDSFSAPQLTALRFLVAAVPAVVLPRPAVSWAVLLGVGATLFAGQFLFQFFAIAHGMPPGLASIVAQTQALFTIVFAALALGQWPTRRQMAGSVVALGGLAVIAGTVGQDLTVSGLVLTLVSAVSWGIGNILLKRLHDVEMLTLVVWTSLVPPLPSLALSLLLDRDSLFAAPGRASTAAIVAALYLGLIATVGAYAVWGALLRRYPAATVTPFALLVPFVAAYGSSLAFGERFGPARLAGMALVLLGLAVLAVSWGAPKGAR
jgi:O-acetylserine/cysteine efflux transporter